MPFLIGLISLLAALCALPIASVMPARRGRPRLDGWVRQRFAQYRTSRRRAREAREVADDAARAADADAEASAAAPAHAFPPSIPTPRARETQRVELVLV